MESALFNEWAADFVEEAVEEAVADIVVKLLNKGHPPVYVAEIVNFPVDKITKIAETKKSEKSIKPTPASDGDEEVQSNETRRAASESFGQAP